MSCNEIQDKLTAYLLGELDAAQAEGVRRHLEECQECRDAARELEATIKLVRKGLADTAVNFPQKLSEDRRRAIFTGLVRASPKIKRRRLFEVSFWRLAACLAVMLVLGSLLLPNLGKVRESAMRVNDAANLNGIYKAAASWGMDPRDSSRPAMPPSLDILLNDKTISPGILVNTETRKPVEYYPVANATDGDRVLLVSRGKKGRNIVKVSGSGTWVEDGTPEAAKLDRQLAELKKQESARGDVDSFGMAEFESSSYLRADCGYSAGQDTFAMAGKMASPEIEGPPKTVVDYWKAGKADIAGTVAEVEHAEKQGAELGRGVVLPASAAKSVSASFAQQTSPEGSAVRDMSSKMASKTALKRFEVSGPSDFVRAEAPVVAPQIQMAEIKVDTKMAQNVAGDNIKRLQNIHEFQKGWGVSVADADTSKKSGSGGGGGAGGGTVRGGQVTSDFKGEMLPSASATRKPTGTTMPVTDAAPSNIAPKRALGVNPFVSVAENQFSTFGIDVDTASYTLTRNYINRGELPPPEEVRTEEFVNYFDYAYQPPRNKTFAVYSEIGSTPFGRGLALLKIGVQAQRLGREQKRPLALTLLIDTSGSMATPDRIELLKSALHRMIERLDPNDLVAIVQFDSQARLLLAHTPASEKGKILAIIDAMQTTGSTNLEEGMKLAYAIAARTADSRRLSRVMLLSDGVANLGTVAAEEILGSVEKYRKQGIYCSVFGFGSGTYNDAMLQTLADKGDGVYAFIDSVDEAERVLVNDLAARMNIVARDAKIQVEFNPKRVMRFRQLGYEKRQLKKEEFRDDTVDAGEVGSGQCATALYELELNRNYTEPIGTVRVRYKNVLTDVVEEIEQPIVLQSQPPAFEAMDAHFRLAAGVAEFAEVLRGSPYAAGQRLEDVAGVLRPVTLELNVDRRISELARMVECGLAPKFTE